MRRQALELSSDTKEIPQNSKCCWHIRSFGELVKDRILWFTSDGVKRSTPFPQPVTSERQQESGTSVIEEKVTFFQSRYSSVPQQFS